MRIRFHIQFHISGFFGKIANFSTPGLEPQPWPGVGWGWSKESWAAPLRWPRTASHPGWDPVGPGLPHPPAHSPLKWAGGGTVPFQGTWNLRACGVACPAGLPVTWAAPPRLLASPSQEEEKQPCCTGPATWPGTGVGLAQAQRYFWSALCLVYLRRSQDPGSLWAWNKRGLASGEVGGCL